MLVTIEGIYDNGRIELMDEPPHVERARVLVTFLAPETALPVQRRMVFGQFKGERTSTEEDFRFAEWHGEAEEPDGD